MSSEEAHLLRQSSFFSATHYARESGIDFADDLAACLHYLEIGHARKLSPSPHFDPAYYLETNADVAAAGVNPLVHYLRNGRGEGRRPTLSRSARAPKPLAPPESAWRKLAHLRSGGLSDDRAAIDMAGVVDVIIPVYRGIDDTLACIHSVLLAHNETPYRLIVVDDESPQPELSAQLVTLAETGLILLLRNDSNLGFVGTVNRGMRLSAERDVILLNSDTVVYDRWLDRMRRQAYGEDRIATVTPLSNNATIFSYPYTLQSNNQQLDVDFVELDRIAAIVNASSNVTVPTGVGFCFYIRRTALREIGFFDEELFGKGYGEENDFCMRAIESGWVNLAALDVFVRHTGEVSFGPTASASKREGYRRLLAAHPRYDGLVAACIRRDPMKEGRSRIDVGRFARVSRGTGVLMVEHGWGGGIERHVTDLAQLLERDGVPTLVCTAARETGRHLLKRLNSDDYPNLPTIDWNDVPGSAELLRSLDLRHVHLHSLVAFTPVEVRNMLRAIALAGLDYYYTIHDYTPICPRVTMIDWGGSFCDTPSQAYCRLCVERDGSPFGKIDVGEWRQLYREVMDGAARIIVPAADVADRLRSHAGLAYDFLERPHPAMHAPSDAPVDRPGGTLRTVGLIGAIGPHKGSRLLRALSLDAQARGLPLRFIVYGYTDFQDADAFPNLTVTGAYQEDAFIEIFRRDPSDVALFASVWPETFCYTLDHAFNNQIYPVTFKLGAPAARIEATGFGRTIPIKYLFDPAGLNDLLLAIDLPGAVPPVTEAGRAWTSATEYYAAADA